MIGLGTVEDFIGYAKMYEFSQDHYEMQKGLLELDLTFMHLESYDFIEENRSTLSPFQRKQICVENVYSDRREETFTLFTEKVEGFLGKIANFFNMILTGIGNFFKRIYETFSGQNREAKKLREDLEKANSRTEALQDAINAGRSLEVVDANVVAFTAAGAQLGQTVEHGANMVNKILTPGVLPPTPIPKDTTVAIILKNLMGMAGHIPDTSDNHRNLMAALVVLEDEYTVQAPHILVNLDNLLAGVEDVMHLGIPREIGSMGLTDSLIQSFERNLATHGQKIERIREDLKIHLDDRPEWRVSERELQKKLEGLNLLKKTFNTYFMDQTDIGTPDSTNLITNAFNRLFKTNEEQQQRRDDLDTYYDQNVGRLARTKELGKGWGPLGWVSRKTGSTAADKQKTNFFSYINNLYRMGHDIYGKIGPILHGLTQHIEYRKKIINDATNLKNQAVRIIAEAQNMA